MIVSHIYLNVYIFSIFFPFFFFYPYFYYYFYFYFSKTFLCKAIWITTVYEMCFRTKLALPNDKTFLKCTENLENPFGCQMDKCKYICSCNTISTSLYLTPSLSCSHSTLFFTKCQFLAYKIGINIKKSQNESVTTHFTYTIWYSARKMLWEFKIRGLDASQDFQRWWKLTHLDDRLGRETDYMNLPEMF